MDLFNRKKVKQLQNDLSLQKAKADMATYRLNDLTKNVERMYEDLSKYFVKKYKNKYFEIEQKQTRFKCVDINFSAGYVNFDITVFDGKSDVQQKLNLSLFQVSELKQINKKDYQGGNK